MDTRTTEFSLGFAVELGVVAFKGLPWPREFAIDTANTIFSKWIFIPSIGKEYTKAWKYTRLKKKSCFGIGRIGTQKQDLIIRAP